MILFALATFGATVVAFVLYPVFSQAREPEVGTTGSVERELISLEEKKTRLYDAITDLDFEKDAGKVSDSDYQTARNDYMTQVAEILTRIRCSHPETAGQVREVRAVGAVRKKRREKEKRRRRRLLARLWKLRKIEPRRLEVLHALRGSLRSRLRRMRRDASRTSEILHGLRAPGLGMKRFTPVLYLALALACGSIATVSYGQPQGGVLRVKLANGTSGGPGRAEKVTLFQLSNQMVPVKEMGAVSGNFEIDHIQVEGERPMLLQVTSSGVNYNTPVRFGRGYEADVDVTVYDVISKWDDKNVRLSTARILYRRDGDKLLVDEVFVVENTSKPPKTFHDPEGSFRFQLPTTDLLELHSVSARGQSGMPVPQQASPDASEQGVYVTKTDFKPGETEVVISYEVSYGKEGYELKSRALYPISELYVFVAPTDVRIDASGWENLGPEPEGRFVAIRKRDVAAGAPIELKLSGGTAQVAAEGGGSTSQGGGQRTITVLPDSMRYSKAVLVALMAAALGYGLITSLYPTHRG